MTYLARCIDTIKISANITTQEWHNVSYIANLDIFAKTNISKVNNTVI
jgi:hypothetical protein